MFMRTTLHPAAHARAELPSTYCEREDPSRPCTSSTVRHSPAFACQWQWQSTWLAPRVWAAASASANRPGALESSRPGTPSPGSTSMMCASGSGKTYCRGRKLPIRVCRCPLPRNRRGENSCPRRGARSRMAGLKSSLASLTLFSAWQALRQPARRLWASLHA
jgi:hypothetical protein